MTQTVLIPDYWHQAISTLSNDPILESLIRTYPDICLQSRGEPFVTLARSIIGQQISVKAADSVWARFGQTVRSITPENLLQRGRMGLEDCGLSTRKKEYLLDLAHHFASGQIQTDQWTDMSDDQIITQLTTIRGIGRWTAEMFLIFNLLRPDVFPVDDIGLQRAIGQHFHAGERPDLKTLKAHGERWRPYRTVATWYLWRSLDPVPVEY